MAGTTKTLFVLGAVAVASQFGAAVAGAADIDVPPGSEAVDKQNYAPKLAPQDMTFDSHQIDDDGKFSAPKKAPNDKQAASRGDDARDRAAAPGPPDEDSLARSGAKGSKILDDYDPTRLGVSADEAKTGKKGDAKGDAKGDTKSDAKSDEKAAKAAKDSKVGEKSGKVDAKADARADARGDAKADAKDKSGSAKNAKPAAADAALARDRQLTKSGFLEPKQSVPWAAAGVPSAAPAHAAAPALSAPAPAASAYQVLSGVEKYHSAPAAVLAASATATSGPLGGAVSKPAAAAPTSAPALALTPAAAAKTTSSVTAPAAHAAAGAEDAKAQKQEAEKLQQTSQQTAEAQGSKSEAGAQGEAEAAAAAAALAHERSFGKLVGAALMIVTSEIGDKTFFIAALMAMKHPHLFVFSSSYSAMVVMTVLSMVLGLILPSLLSKRVTTLLAALLFLVFGYRLLREGLHMDSSIAATDELEDVEHDLEMHDSTLASEKAEGGGARAQTAGGALRAYAAGLANLAALVLSPLWIQIFAMTFLGEWGDRSQIATVAMGTGSGWGEVLVGCLVGHFITTVIAVIGGKILAQHLSLRSITLSGAACFLLFAVIYFNDWLNQ